MQRSQLRLYDNDGLLMVDVVLTRQAVVEGARYLAAILRGEPEEEALDFHPWMLQIAPHLEEGRATAAPELYWLFAEQVVRPHAVALCLWERADLQQLADDLKRRGCLLSLRPGLWIGELDLEGLVDVI